MAVPEGILENDDCERVYVAYSGESYASNDDGTDDDGLFCTYCVCSGPNEDNKSWDSTIVNKGPGGC